MLFSIPQYTRQHPATKNLPAPDVKMPNGHQPEVWNVRNSIAGNREKEQYKHVWILALKNKECVWILGIVDDLLTEVEKCQTGYKTYPKFSSVTQVVSDSLGPHELQHAWPPCPSPTPGVHSNPCPPSQ